MKSIFFFTINVNVEKHESEKTANKSGDIHHHSYHRTYNKQAVLEVGSCMQPRR